MSPWVPLLGAMAFVFTTAGSNLEIESEAIAVLNQTNPHPLQIPFTSNYSSVEIANALTQFSKNPLKLNSLPIHSKPGNSLKKRLKRQANQKFGDINALDANLNPLGNTPVDTKVTKLSQIFEALHDQDHEYNLQILSLALEVYDLYIYAWENNLKNSAQNLITLQKRMKPFEDRILGNIADSILSGKFAGAVAYSKRSARAANAIKHFLPQIISKAYNKNKNRVNSVPNLLTFVNALPWLYHHGLGYGEILSQMKVNKDIDGHTQIHMVAVKVKAGLDTFGVNKLKVVEESRELFEASKAKLPLGVRRLLWDKYVVIEHTHVKDYNLFSKENGGILLYPEDNDGTSASGHHQRWTVKALDGGRYFRIENVETKRVLSTGPKDLVHGTVSESKDQNRVHWEVLPLSDGTLYRFKNRANKLCLDAPRPKMNCKDSRLGFCHDVITTTCSDKVPSQKWKIL